MFSYWVAIEFFYVESSRRTIFFSRNYDFFHLISFCRYWFLDLILSIGFCFNLVWILISRFECSLLFFPTPAFWIWLFKIEVLRWWWWNRGGFSMVCLMPTMTLMKKEMVIEEKGRKGKWIRLKNKNKNPNRRIKH